MASKLKQLGKFLLFLLWSNTIYGFLVYYIFTWLAQYSLVYAYLGNLAMIILGLTLDECGLRMLQSPKLITQLKNDKDFEKNYRLTHTMIENFVSFKAALYLFYIFILLISQIIHFTPSLVSPNVQNFIDANSYSILFLLAFDTFIAQFAKDRIQMKKIAENLQKSFAEPKENENDR